MSLTLALNSAISGLMTAQKGLDTVSHNIANVNTVGYSRQIFSPESRVLAGQGVGVQVGLIDRRVDEGLRTDMRESISLYNTLSSSQRYYDRVQDMFGRPGDNSTISHSLSSFAQELEVLGVESGTASQTDAVVSKASDLTGQMNRLAEQLQALRASADAEIAAGVNEVNAHLKDIADLNEKITLASATGNAISDLEDKRDESLRKLSELMDVKFFVRENGAAIVYTAAGETLVDSKAKTLSHVANNNPLPWQSVDNGKIQGIYIGTSDITDDIRSGKLKGLIDMRDSELVNLQAQMDELAQTMKTQFNQIHNQGTGYPSLVNDVDGTRNFIDTSTQSITIDSPAADSVITILNRDGTQAATTTLRTILGGASGTMDTFANNLQTWLQGQGLGSASVGFSNGTSGNLQIDLGDSSYGLAFRDQKSGSAGAATADLPLTFDADGNGTADESVSGLSNFLGLNDFFVSDQKNWQWDTPVQSKDYMVRGGVTLSFSTEEDGIGVGQVIVLTNDKLTDIADRINNNPSLKDKVTAEVVREGNGERLRIINQSGGELAVTRTAGSANAFDQLGLGPSSSGLSQGIGVHSKLVNDPNSMSRGSVQYDNTTGEYYVSEGDNSTANALAKVFSSSHDYGTAGGLSTAKLRLTDYAASMISSASSRAATNESRLEYQGGLTEALSLKNAEVSAVNLDEELSQLMIFEQSYSAAAKVISTTQQMLDVLNNLIR